MEQKKCIRELNLAELTEFKVVIVKLRDDVSQLKSDVLDQKFFASQ